MLSSDFGQESGLWAILQRFLSENADGIIAGLIIPLLGWVLKRMFQRSLPYLGRLGGGFGILLGLRRLALRRYRRALRAKFAYVDNIYLALR